MRLELWMLLITGAIVFHIYTDGKYTKNLMMYKKYFKMGGVVIAAFIFYVLLIFLAAQLLESNYLTSKLIGERLGLHPLAVLFSIFVFGALFGIVGIIFATPLMATTVFIFKSNLEN